MKDKIIERELSYKLGGIFFEIQEELGRFCRERQYGDALEKKLTENKIDFKREYPVEIGDRKSNFIDFVIGDKILVELKAKPFVVKQDYYQMKRYLETTNLELGLIVNLQDKYLKPKRVLNSRVFADSDKFVALDRASGFTIIETLVVIAVIVLLSSLLILYTRSGENQVLLFREQSRLIAALNRAKYLSIQLFNAPNTCGFGVYFSPTSNSFIIFRDSASDCQNSDNTYSGTQENFETYALSSRIKYGQLTLTNIVFIPPDPKTLIDNNPTKTEGVITLQTLDGGVSLKVKVTNAGQITTQ